MQPYDSAFAGAALSQRLGKPWVADLGDPWALDEMMVYPSALHRRRDLARMGEQLGTAAAIVMSTPEAVRRLLAEFPRLADRPVVAIPMASRRRTSTASSPERTDGTFRIVHTGYLHTELGLQHRRSLPLRRVLRGSVPGSTFSRVRTSTSSRRSTAARRDPRSATRSSSTSPACSPRPTARSLRVARSWSCTATSRMRTRSSRCGRRTSLPPTQNFPPGVRATIVPGKTYEYLASGTTILGAVPEGDARDILTEAGNAVIVRPEDVDGAGRGPPAQDRGFRAGAGRSRGPTSLPASSTDTSPG